MKPSATCTRSLARLGVLTILCVALAACMPSPEAQQAMTDARGPDAAFNFLFSGGSALGLREALPETFPQVSDLTEPGSNASTAMLSRLRSGGMDDDFELSLYAYALEQQGNASAVGPLRQFVERSIGGPFTWSPYFATHAILSLTGQLDPATDINWYSIIAMQAIAASGSLSAATASGITAAAAPASPQSCWRRYLLVDASNQPLYRKDGTTKAFVEGFERACPNLPDALRDHYKTEVVAGGGSFTTSEGQPVEDGPFGNEPTRQFDCAGYALRELNDYRKWWVDPRPAFTALYEAGVLEEISESTAVEGDKVFYWKNAANAQPDHVAEVHEPGGLLTWATVWNADEMSGLWQAKSDATYFTKRKLTTRRFFKWKGDIPYVIPDPDFAANPTNCLVNPVVDGQCPTTTTTISAKPDNACQVQDLCAYCMGPKSGSAWQGEMLVSWDTETRLAQLNYEATNLTTFEVIEWVVTFNVNDGPKPINATLTVTHNKVTGKGGEGSYTFAGGTKSKINSADITLEFSGRNVTGSLVVHTENGKQTTVEIHGGSCY